MKNSLTLAMLLSLLAAGCSDSDSNDPSSLPAADTTQDVVVVGPVVVVRRLRVDLQGLLVLHRGGAAHRYDQKRH